MIFNKSSDRKEQEDEDALYSELPPSYQAALADRSTGSRLSGSSRPTGDSKSPYTPQSTDGTGSNAMAGPSTPRPPKAKSRATTFFAKVFGPVGTARQVKETTQSIIRDLVEQRSPASSSTPTTTASSPSPASPSHPHTATLSPTDARSVLDSCASACRSQDLYLPDILRTPFIENHTAIYWAVLNHDSDPTPSDPDKLALLLLKHALPPTSEYVQALSDDVRAACTLASNNELWIALRAQFPCLERPSAGPEALIMAGAPGGIRDCAMVDVSTGGADGAFCVRMSFPLFQKRMRVVGIVGVEFIARGRLFRFEFFVNGTHGKWCYSASKGTWIASVALLPPSAPTKLYGRLTIDPTKATDPKTSKKRSSLTASFQSIVDLTPEYTHAREVQQQMPDASLEHEGDVFVDEAGTLECKFEAQFTRPAGLGPVECVIC